MSYDILNNFKFDFTYLKMTELSNYYQRVKIISKEFEQIRYQKWVDDNSDYLKVLYEKFNNHIAPLYKDYNLLKNYMDYNLFLHWIYQSTKNKTIKYKD
jgi:hypothetical protein